MNEGDKARTLLLKAKHDLKALTHMMDREAFSDEIFGFHVQQAIEKCLKAWLANLNDEVPRTHDLNYLLVLLTNHGIDSTPYQDLVEFTLYAVQFRYEEYDLIDTPIDREECITHVSKLLVTVEKGLPSR